MSLKQRLAQVPGFEEYMSLMDQWEAEDPEGGIVESVWKLLRMGTPLIVIFNLLKPENPMSFDPTPDAKKAKMYIYKFAEQCKNELGIEDIFTISDLLKNDTTGFVKVRSWSCPPRRVWNRTARDIMFVADAFTNSGYDGGEPGFRYRADSWNVNTTAAVLGG